MRNRYLVLALIAVLAAMLAPTATAHVLPRSSYSVQLVHKVDHARGRVLACTQALGVKRRDKVARPYRPPGTSVIYRAMVLRYWQRVARNCERHVLPYSNDWRTSVRIVQRVFPGTEGWLLSCSRPEGAHGIWVWNGHYTLAQHPFPWNDRAGGNLQFRYSTYDAHDDAAFALARRRGYAVPKQAGYLNAMGQAVVGGYMRFTGRDDSHWMASWSTGCR